MMRREKVKKKVWFAKNNKMPIDAGMLCTIDSDTFYLFMKNTDSGFSCHIIMDINELIQGSSRNMSAMKKGKLHVKVLQVDGPEWAHTLWPVKFCLRASMNLFSLTCKLSQGNKISSNY